MAPYEQLEPFAENRAVLVELQAPRHPRRHPEQRRPGHARGGRAPCRLRRPARSGAERRGHRAASRPTRRPMRSAPLALGLRGRRDPVRVEQLLGRDRRHLVRLHHALDQPLRPAARRRSARARRASARSLGRRARLLRLPDDPSHDHHDPRPSRRRADQRADPARLRDDPDPAGARRSSPSCTAPSSRGARQLLAGRRRAREAARRRRASRLPGRDASRSATATGRSRRCRRRCNAAASRSPARSTRRWSSTPSTRAPTRT